MNGVRCTCDIATISTCAHRKLQAIFFWYLPFCVFLIQKWLEYELHIMSNMFGKVFKLEIYVNVTSFIITSVTLKRNEMNHRMIDNSFSVLEIQVRIITSNCSRYSSHENNIRGWICPTTIRKQLNELMNENKRFYDFVEDEQTETK